MIRFLLCLSILLLPACTSIVISPLARDGEKIDMAGQRIVLAEHGVKIACSISAASVRPAPIEQNYASFTVAVTNQRNVLLPLDISHFILIDDQGSQYQATDPGELTELLTVDAPNLIPYPYVGYYYLADSKSGQARNQLSSESSFYSSRRPEHILLDALPVVDVLPAATVIGAIYFPVELRTMTGFKLLYRVGALAGQESRLITIPFVVEEK